MPSALRKQRDNERKQSTRLKLITAATEVFAAKGYHPALISDIVATAGVGQGTFYRFFSGKRDIFDSLRVSFFEKLTEQFSPLTDALPTTLAEYQAASHAALVRVATLLERERALVLMVLREAPAIDHEAAASMEQMFDQLAQLAKHYLDHAIAGGFARPCNSQLVSQALIGLGLRHAHAWLQGDYDHLSADEYVREVTEFAFYGMAPLGQRA